MDGRDEELPGSREPQGCKQMGGREAPAQLLEGSVAAARVDFAVFSCLCHWPATFSGTEMKLL